MLQYRVFTFNPIQVNTYVLFDETGECAVIDDGAYYNEENAELFDFIDCNSLKPKLLLCTHGHIDHILGNSLFVSRYGIGLSARFDGMQYFDRASTYATAFGIRFSETAKPQYDLTNTDKVTFGNTELKILHTPGHAVGSVCFYSEKDGLVFTGDLIFRYSYGRTDLPGGDFDMLQNSIIKEILTLPDNTIILPGHGPQSTVADEKRYNPVLD